MIASKIDRTIIVDSREKTPWTFPNSRVEGLKTGDYTLEGLEDVLTIDRKATTGEFSHNIIEKRFDRELERFKEFKYAFIVCEFDYADVEFFPQGSNIPKYLWKTLRIKASFIKKKIAEYQTAGINIIFAGRYGKEAALTIFREVLLRETRPDAA